MKINNPLLSIEDHEDSNHFSNIHALNTFNMQTFNFFQPIKLDTMKNGCKLKKPAPTSTTPYLGEFIETF